MVDASRQTQQTQAADVLHFGTRSMVDALCERITTGFGNPHKAEPALVVGIFGEWGSGKSTVLGGVGRHFAGALPGSFKALDGAEGKDPPPITVPIEFNAWRYEREEHLIVPLLKTAQSTLRKVFDEHRTPRDKTNDWAEGVLDLLADVILAVGKGLDWEFKLFDTLSIKSKAPGEIFDEYQKRRKTRAEAEKTGIDRMDSLYVNFHSHFRALTGRDGELFAQDMARLARRSLPWYALPQRLWHWLRPSPVPPPIKRPQLNLVFLIDDLDRCLPEKAVEMLEVIKLFLEVEGCAFVLAVDDEVIERGILHRYRDYLFQQNSATSNGASTPNTHSANHANDRTAAPITGSEYLEKIIHLPIRLARPSKQLIREFLLDRYGKEVFAPERRTVHQLESTEAIASSRVTEPTRAERLVDSPLLPIFMDLVPPVPRRLVRAVELFKTLLSVAHKRGVGVEIDARFLAVLAVVQVCAPELFRFARRNHPHFIDDLRAWRTGKENIYNIEKLIESLDKKLNDLRTEEAPSPGSIDLAHVRLQLAQLINKGLHGRGGFDPRKLADLDFPEKLDAGAHLVLWADQEVAVFTPSGALPVQTLSDVEVSLRGQQIRVDQGELAQQAPPTGPIPSPTPASPTPGDTPEPFPEPEREAAYLEDSTRFIQGLTAREPEAWRNALAREAAALQNRVLDANTFEQLLRTLEATAFLRSIDEDSLFEWLNLLGPHLNPQHSLTLAHRVATSRGAGNTEAARL